MSEPSATNKEPNFVQRTVGTAFLKTARTAISTIKPGDWMSALQPLMPWLPMLMGRQWDFPVGRNLNYQPRQNNKVTFKMLRGLANNSEIVRLAIETRKDQLCAQKWQVRGKEDLDVKETDPRIKKWTKFFSQPDGYNRWADWYRILLEELFVTDAVSIYRPRTRGGQLLALRLLDGSTIFPLIDDLGYTPQDGNPAYQQILKGVPKGNYTTKELIYAVRNKRIYSTYGFPPVEQVINSMQTDIERQRYSLSYFTEGSMPDGYITMAEGIPPDQIKAFEERTNNMLAGNASGRRQMPFWPFGTKVETLKQPNALKDDFDEWIARKICFALSIPPTPFIKAMNRANAEAQHDQALSEGQGPVMAWTCELMTAIMAAEGDEDLELAFLDDKELDLSVQSEMLVNETAGAIITLNEARAIKGLDPFPEPSADQLMLKTPTGWLPLPGSAMDQEMQQQKLEQQVTINQSKPAPAPPTAGDDGKKIDGKKPAKKSQGQEVRLEPLPFYLGTANPPIAILAGKIAPILSKAGKQAAPQVLKAVKAKIDKFRKADETDEERAARLSGEATDIATSIDLSSIEAVFDITPEELTAVAAQTGRAALAQIGAGNKFELVNQVFDEAVDYAQERAAELIGRKWVNGKLVDNPAAEWSIDSATRNEIREIILGGLNGTIKPADITGAITNAGAFSPERAELIARTEIHNAQNRGALDGYKVAAAAGVSVKKAWVADDGACDVCLRNEAVGAIALDKQFPSGDDAPTAHPRCECAITAVVPAT